MTKALNQSVAQSGGELLVHCSIVDVRVTNGAAVFWRTMSLGNYGFIIEPSSEILEDKKAINGWYKQTPKALLSASGKGQAT